MRTPGKHAPKVGSSGSLDAWPGKNGIGQDTEQFKWTCWCKESLKMRNAGQVGVERSLAFTRTQERRSWVYRICQATVYGHPHGGRWNPRAHTVSQTIMSGTNWLCNQTRGLHYGSRRSRRRSRAHSWLRATYSGQPNRQRNSNRLNYDMR